MSLDRIASHRRECQARMWTWAYEWIEGPALIRFEAEGKWQYSPASRECTADGDLNAMICARNCLMADAPVGALLAKIGGSTAGARDGKVFLVGRKAVISIDPNTSGPIMLSINDELTGMSDNSGTVKVKIFVKQLPSFSVTPGAAPAKTAIPVQGSGGAIPIPGAGIK